MLDRTKVGDMLELQNLMGHTQNMRVDMTVGCKTETESTDMVEQDGQEGGKAWAVTLQSKAQGLDNSCIRSSKEEMAVPVVGKTALDTGPDSGTAVDFVVAGSTSRKTEAIARI